MKAKKVKQMVIAALVACAGILASNAAVVASGEKEFALLPPVTLTGLSATAITVGQTLANSTISGTATTEDFGAVAGSFTWNSPTTAPTVSDSQTTAYAVTFTPTDPNHSKTGSGTVKLTVNGKAITPTVTPSKASATYGDSGWNTLPTLTVTGDSKTLTSGTDYTAAWSPASVSGAGTYTVTVTLKGNYSGSQTATYTVNKKTITVTPTANQSKTYGDSDPALTYDNSPALVGTDKFTGALARASGETVGTYAINQGTLALGGNYTLSFTTGKTFAINQREVTLAWGATTFSYTGSAQKPTCTAGNLVSGDSCTVTVSGEQTNAGTGYTATATGLSNGNYKLPSAKTTTFAISAKSITPTVTPSKASATYGDSGWDTLPTVTVTGDSKTLASDTDYTSAWSPATPTGAGTYTVTVTLKGNYSGSQTATYTVNKRAVTLTSGTKQFFYDGQAHSNSTLKVSGDGFAAGEGVRGNSFATITEIGSTPNAFGYEFTGTGRAENYDVSCVQGTLTVIQYVEPSVEITKISLADERDGTVEYSYKVDGEFEVGEYDVLIKVSVANGTKSTVVTHESVAGGSTVSTNLNVQTLFGKAYPNVALFAELKKALRGVQLWAGGPIWAECNVGATEPEEYGYYFWWGDTVGYKRNEADNGWDAVDGSNTGFSFSGKNCPTYNKTVAQLHSGGYIDANSEDGKLMPEYDAARAHLKGDWRMPTSAEIQALIENCNHTWTTRNGVEGYAVTGKGDYESKSIFLPAAGYGVESYLNNSGSYGRYWSSTPSLSSGYASGYALDLNFDSDNFIRFSYNRCQGYSVRPVR